MYLFTGLFSAVVSFLFWGTVYISFKKYFSKHHKVILFLGILAVFTSSGLLYVFIEQLFFPSPKDFKPTYHMHQTWLNKCVMPGKQSDENFWCRDDCKAEKKIRNWTFINQAFFCSIAAWNGVNFLPCLGRLPAAHAVRRRARASSRILLWLPWQTTCNSPPVMHHGPWNETEIRWVCTFIPIEIPQIVASPVKHTRNHGQH